MGKNWRLSSLVLNMGMVIGLALIWNFLAPIHLGGQVSYVLVNGNSMEPIFHGGDLVVIRHAQAYQIGDVVTYTDAQMNENVIHRIIGTQRDRFIIKGDNNSWIDAYQPTRKEIIGKLWIHLPKLGATVKWVQLPFNMALMAGLLGGFLMLNLTVTKPNKNGKGKNKAAGNPSGIFEMSLYGFGILALVFGVLAIFAYSRPVMRNADNIQFTQTGVFFYSAPGTPAGIYDSESTPSGQPVFTRLTCALDLGFRYTLVGDQLENISNDQQLYAMVLDEQSGWQRTIPLMSDTSLAGNASTSTASLDLCQVQALVASVEEKTGLRLSNYTLVVAARVLAAGSIMGQPFADTFEPRLTFKFDSLHFYIPDNSSLSDKMKTTRLGSLPNPGKLANTFPFLGANPTIGGIRSVAVLGLVISLSGLLALGIIFYAASRHQQETFFRIKYGSIILDVYGSDLKMDPTVIDVTSIEDLAKLAVRQNAMILHLPCDFAHYYLVQVEGTTYRYTAGKDRAINSGIDRFWLWLSHVTMSA